MAILSVTGLLTGDVILTTFPQIKFSFSISGGVGANQEIRTALKNLCMEHMKQFFAPPLNLCTDNGLMIAYAGGIKYILGECDDFNLSPRTRWPIDIEHTQSIGYGKKGRKV